MQPMRTGNQSRNPYDFNLLLLLLCSFSLLPFLPFPVLQGLPLFLYGNRGKWSDICILKARSLSE